MRPVFPPATIPHVWRQTWALTATAVWVTIGLYWLVVLYGWLAGLGGWDWGIGMDG